MYSRRIVCYSPVHARLRRGQVVFHCLPRFELERTRSTHATYAFSKTRTSRNVRKGAGRTYRNRATVHKNHLLDFPILMKGWLFGKESKWSCNNLFLWHKSHLKYQTDADAKGDHTRLKIWYNPSIIRQYIHIKTAENHELFSK